MVAYFMGCSREEPDISPPETRLGILLLSQPRQDFYTLRSSKANVLSIVKVSY